jgi:microcystin-dependent protein
MSQAYIGEIRLFAFNRVPTNWMACMGQLLPISAYSPLFSVIGTTYGGDGQSNFALPNLQGRVAIGMGQGNNLPNYNLGQPGGEETHTLIETEMPTHGHALMSSTATATTATPGTTVHLATASAGNLYAPPPQIGPAFDVMAACVTTAGNSLPHNNMMPTLVCNYCICVEGVFPSQG